MLELNLDQKAGQWRARTGAPPGVVTGARSCGHSLLSMAPQDRDPGLADAMYDAVMQTILTNAPALPEESTTAAAVTFRTLVPDLTTLSDAERALLSEWLDRVSGS